jgi:tetratricopeptide (TPR) repeat protein
MAAQEALKKRKVFTYKLYQPQLEDVAQALETLPPLLRAEMAIRLAIVRAWCYFAAHLYSEAETCCDRAIEMCLQVRSRVQWSVYTLAAMFTMHQIYLCTHATQKTNMVSRSRTLKKNRKKLLILFFQSRLKINRYYLLVLILML